MARELAHRELAPRAAALDAGDQDVLAECWRLLTGLGLDRALLAEEHGGAAVGVPDLLATIEELAAGDGGDRDVRAALQRGSGDARREQLADLPAGARWALVPAAGTELMISDGQLDGRVACALGAHDADGLVFLLGRPEPAALAVACRRNRG